MRTGFALKGSLSVCAALLSVMAVVVFAAVGSSVQLVASTLLMMGGNEDPTAHSVERQLSDHFNPGHLNYGFAGYGLVKVVWPARIVNGYMRTQLQGVRNLDVAILAALAAADNVGDGVVVVGYSSSANVVIRQMRNLAAAGAPDIDKLRFIVIGGPNRPNGGLLTRFVRFPIQLLGIENDGANPDTDYQLTDISWEYDPISDFPTYLMNPFALLNAAFAFNDLHVNYSDADLTGVIENSNLTGTAPDGTEYVTIAAPRLPLLSPLRMLHVPEPILLAVEPALKVLVDLAYDRTIPVWEATRIRLLPPPAVLLAAIPAFLRAIGVGIHNALAATRGPTTGDLGPSAGPAPARPATRRVIAASHDHPASTKRPAAGARTYPRHRAADPVGDSRRAEVGATEVDPPTSIGQIERPEKLAAAGKSGKAERSRGPDAAPAADRGRDTDTKDRDRARAGHVKRSADAA